MAVHTTLSEEQLSQACALFGLSRLLSYRGIPQGSQNTLYRVETPEGRHVLRLSEGRADAEVAYELALVKFLADAGFPCPWPRVSTSGRLWEPVQGRQACVFQYMAGELIAPGEVTDEHCEQVGEQLGHLHVLGEAHAGSLPNRFSPAQISRWAEGLLAVDDIAVREAAPVWLEEARSPWLALPRGHIHADLFMDNVLWIGGQVTAVLDFEMACVDALALDVAIALCAWCYGDRFLRPRARALLRGYQSRRRLTGAERDGLYGLARFAAARYAVTRVRDFHLSPLPPDRLVKKDWRRYRDRLLELRAMGPAGFAELAF